MLADLDALFCAVTARLRRIADGSDERSAQPMIDANDHIRESVLECVVALDQLHEMLAHEVERRHRLEKIVTDARAALERAPPEIVAVLGLTLHVPPITRLRALVPAGTA
ncbi:MAG: hypothetical protein ABI781_17760 [Burkholderiales bacterium]